MVKFECLYSSRMKTPIESENPVVKAIIEGTAPRPAQLAAARGILPLPANDLFEVLVAFAGSSDEEVAGHARETLAAKPTAELAEAAGGTDAPVAVLSFLAEKRELAIEVHEAVIRNPRTPADAVVGLVQHSANGELLDIVSQNQQLLIRNPALIEAILTNPARTPDAERRASETKKEFFEKERGQQQIAEELRARGNEAAAEFFEAAAFDGDDIDIDDAIFLADMIEVPDSETDDSWLALEYIEELYEETPEQRQRIINSIIGEFNADGELESERVSVINHIMKMGMKDRVKMAMKGDREARNILIRDPNRIVAQAVVNNPRITEQEMEKIAAMRSVTEDILRQIANNRQWARSYSIVHNLARNPRTPIANVLTILSRLQLRDLAALSKNKNVSDAVRRQALRLSQARTGNK